MKSPKFLLFWFFRYFFIHFEEISLLLCVLILWFSRILGSRWWEFWKIHDRFSFLDCNIFLGGCLFSAIWGVNRVLRNYFPPISRDPGWEIGVYLPPILRTLGGKSRLFPPHNMRGKRARRRRKFWGFEILDFLYKNVFWGPKILKKFRLRRAIRMLSFLYKCISETKTLQNFRLRRADRFVIFVNWVASFEIQKL